MRGHVAVKGNKYYIVVDMRDENGKRKRKWLSGADGKGFDSKRDAEREMPGILSKLYDGTFREQSDETFGEMMASWLIDKQSAVRPGTWSSYAWLVNTHLVPHLGKVKLAKLEAKQLHRLYHQILLPKISASSIKKLHALIMDALNRAVTWGEIPRNVAASIELPKGKKKKFEVWDEEQLQAFLDMAKLDPYFIVFELAASTGMRQSEILALRWSDVDLDAKILSVRQTYTKAVRGHDFGDVKSMKSERAIALFPETVAHLRSHKARQNEFKLSNRKTYRDHGLVVQSSVGTPLGPRNMMRNFYALLDRLRWQQEDRLKKGEPSIEVPRIRFHDLRHTHATILLKNGVHPKIVQERLGHSSITVTFDTYSHVLPNMQEAVLRGIGDSITSGKNANKNSLHQTKG